ncbi:MAG: nitroreductase family protein [Candidatus Krumholzibacteria bacterium]|nr:nitroreductase family protein [Candidatus Krumholzibacteria bacterium]
MDRETPPDDTISPELFRRLVARSRSVRRFDGSAPVGIETLERLVALARLAPSGANRQPLRFWLSCDPALNGEIFACLSWAGYLEDWDGPAPGERPAAYMVILHDTEVAEGYGCDHGIAAQTIMLGAAAGGLGGCIIGSVDRERLARVLDLADRYRILLVLALGFPGETIEVEDVGDDGDIRYWRDAGGAHHVPKRALEDLIVGRRG